MPEGLRELAQDAMAEHVERPSAPRVLIAKREKEWGFACPYGKADEDHWAALLHQAFGTRSRGAMNHFMNVFVELAGDGEWNEEGQYWSPRQNDFDAILAIIHSLAPQNEAQAAYAAQLCALHLSAMKLGKAASKSYVDDRTVAILNKTVRAYGDGIERMARLQGKIQPRTVNQTIEVHYYHDQRDQRSVTIAGGAGSNGGQPHGATPAAPIQCAALPRPCPDRDALPMPSGEGQGRVQGPWWGQRLWRATRRAQRRVQAWRMDE